MSTRPHVFLQRRKQPSPIATNLAASTHHTALPPKRLFDYRGKYLNNTAWLSVQETTPHDENSHRFPTPEFQHTSHPEQEETQQIFLRQSRHWDDWRMDVNAKLEWHVNRPNFSIWERRKYRCMDEQMRSNSHFVLAGMQRDRPQIAAVGHHFFIFSPPLESTKEWTNHKFEGP